MYRRNFNVIGDDMTMTDAAMWIILALLIAIVPIGA